MSEETAKPNPDPAPEIDPELRKRVEALLSQLQQARDGKDCNDRPPSVGEEGKTLEVPFSAEVEELKAMADVLGVDPQELVRMWTFMPAGPQAEGRSPAQITGFYEQVTAHLDRQARELARHSLKRAAAWTGGFAVLLAAIGIFDLLPTVWCSAGFSFLCGLGLFSIAVPRPMLSLKPRSWRARRAIPAALVAICTGALAALFAFVFSAPAAAATVSHVMVLVSVFSAATGLGLIFPPGLLLKRA